MSLSWCLFIVLPIITVSSVEPECDISDFSKVKDATANCKELVIREMEVPGGKTLYLNMTEGSSITFEGTTKFGYAQWDGPLIAVRGTNLTVQGAPGSVLDGQGPLHWDGLGDWGTTKPFFFSVEANRSTLSDITLLNCPHHCTNINASEVVLSGWLIDCSEGDVGVAPEGHEGHNTDGFDVLDSFHLIIKDSVVKNQDDCVAINKGTDVQVTRLHCSGCHGLSLSAGHSNGSIAENTIADVIFSDSVVVDSDNAIHVKTHVDGSYGIVSNITYRNITFSGIRHYGINVQQNYYNGGETDEPRDNIPINGLNMIDVKGSLADEKAVPVYILCAKGACNDWEWSDVKLTGGKEDSCNFKPDGYDC